MEKTTAKGRAGGKGFFAREQEEGNQPPVAAFIEGADHGHTIYTKDRGGKEQPSPAPSSGEKFEAPTPSDSHARHTRALISQVKRRV